MTMTTHPRVRINGALLNQYNGRPVTLLGCVKQIDSSGQKITVETSDSKIIDVILDDPLTENLEGYVEFHGKAMNGKLLAELYIKLDDELSTNLDIMLYDQTVKFSYSCPNNAYQFE